MHSCEMVTPLLILSSIAAANPVTTRSSKPAATPTPSYFSLPQLARFENDPDILPVVAAVPVGIYLDIDFNGFEGSQPGVGGMVSTGVVPNSPPNCIAYSSLGVATITEGQPTMTIVYDDSTVEFFDLLSFYYGCILATTETAAQTPAACTVTATCVSPFNTTVASQSFAFPTTGALVQQMLKAEPVGFKGCRSVNFATKEPLTATRFDTISYVVYSEEPLSPK